MLRTVQVVGALVGIGVASVAAGAEASLAASPRTGEKNSYVYTSELSSVPTGKLGQAFFLNYTLEFGTRVKRINEKYTDVEVTFSRIAIDSTLGEFDSANPSDADGSNLVAQAFRPAIDAPFNLRLDNTDMRIIGVNGPDTSYLPDMTIQLYGRVLGEKHVIESLQPAFLLKADPATATSGETWSKTIMRGGNVGHIEIRLDFTLGGVADGVANVKIAGEHIIKLDQNTPVSQRMAEQNVVGAATWSVTDKLLDDYEVEKSFRLEAGDGQIDLGVNVIEKEHLTRQE